MSTCTCTITIKKIVFRSHFHIKYVTLVETAAKMVRWSFRRTLKYHTIVTPRECDDVNARNVDRPLSISVFNKLDVIRLLEGTRYSMGSETEHVWSSRGADSPERDKFREVHFARNVSVRSAP